MDHSILARLRYQVLCDLDEFIPKGCFKLEWNHRLTLERNPNVNERELSWDEKWGMVAIGISTRLYYESKSRLIAVTPRQSIAIELLEHLGNLASCETTTNPQSERDEATNSLRTSLEEYLNYLPEHEARPLLSLLKDDHQTQKTESKVNTSPPQKADEIKSFITHYKSSKEGWERDDFARPILSAIEETNSFNSRDVFSKLKEFADNGKYQLKSDLSNDGYITIPPSGNKRIKLHRKDLSRRLKRIEKKYNQTASFIAPR